MKKSIILSSIAFLATAAFANTQDACDTVQLFSYPNSEQNRNIVAAKTLPENCLSMQIAQKIVGRCGCYSDLAEATTELAKLKENYQDAYLNRTYKYRFANMPKKETIATPAVVVAAAPSVAFTQQLEDNQKAMDASTAMMDQKIAANAKAYKDSSTALEEKINVLTLKIDKLKKVNKKQTKKISEVNKKANNDNIKFDIDFRTSYDNLNYQTAGGTNPMSGQAQPSEYKNDSLYSMRLWLGMGYAPTDNMFFKGQLSFNKAFGASYGQRATGMGFDTFDWVINENLTDDTLRVRQAYWLWMPTIAGVGTTWSVGRRPATNGYLINLRDDDKAQSPLSHVINMEFDGASVGVKLDALVEGGNFKICAGRGLTNATSWSSQASAMAGAPIGGSNQPNYTVDDSQGNLDNTDMVGFILKAYDDGQYALLANYYRGFDVPGMMMNAPGSPTMASMKTVGDMDGAAVSFKVEGIGDEINDFLDETIIFASYAWTKSNPSDGGTMLGSTDSETGTSYWVGTQMPNLTGGKFGLEYNHGSEHWKPFTFGEDTMAGSKMAVRGSAYEAYWTQPLINKVFSMQVRYTYLDYDYTGSNGFFGDGGAAAKIGSMMANAQNAVETAQDIRVYFRYRY